MNEPKKLYRLDHGMLAGVCGGVAEYFNMDPSLVRLLWVVLTVVSFSLGFWVYLIAAIIPERATSTPAIERRGRLRALHASARSFLRPAWFFTGQTCYTNFLSDWSMMRKKGAVLKRDGRRPDGELL